MEALNRTNKLKKAIQNFNFHTYRNSLNFLKPHQVNALISIQKMDTFVTLPTGYGKSLIFEISPFYAAELGKLQKCIIISPLNAIISQEIEKLGPLAIRISDDFTPVENISKIKYIFGHPEVIVSKGGFAYLSSIVSRDEEAIVCVDEAHCILDWGKEFRPIFQSIGSLRTLLQCRFLFLTATITQQGIKEVQKILGVKHLEVIGIMTTYPLP
jgi:ATP-dependent DNA helicase RecQ